MKANVLSDLINRIFSEIENLIPYYMENQIDKNISDGNVAVCIINESGQIFGKIYGSDKIRGRQSYRIAWIKASQVWITGMKTGEFEKKVFSGEINEQQYGIIRPDFIGWEGGQPIELKDGTTLAVGFSGFRGFIDLEIVNKAVSNIELLA